MKRTLTAATVGLALMGTLATARAEDDPSVGHIPVLRFFADFNTTFVPVQYQRVDFDGELEPATSETVQGLGLGPAVQLRADFESVLIYGDGFYNPLDTGFLYQARAGLMLPQLGGRSQSTLTEYCGTTYTSTE